jgi:hypothetical protein
VRVWHGFRDSEVSRSLCKDGDFVLWWSMASLSASAGVFVLTPAGSESLVGALILDAGCVLWELRLTTGSALLRRPDSLEFAPSGFTVCWLEDGPWALDRIDFDAAETSVLNSSGSVVIEGRRVSYFVDHLRSF